MGGVGSRPFFTFGSADLVPIAFSPFDFLIRVTLTLNEVKWKGLRRTAAGFFASFGSSE
jgi:hypothetical protein